MAKKSAVPFGVLARFRTLFLPLDEPAGVPAPNAFITRPPRSSSRGRLCCIATHRTVVFVTRVPHAVQRAAGRVGTALSLFCPAILPALGSSAGERTFSFRSEALFRQF